MPPVDDGGSQPSVHGENHDQQNAAPESRHALRRENNAREKARNCAFAIERQRDPDGNSKPAGDEQGPSGQLQGVWEPRRNDSGDRHILNEGASEVEARQLFQEREVLHDKRTIEAERPTQGFDVGLGGGLRYEQVGRIASEMLEEEDQRDDTEYGAGNLPQSFREKALHVGVLTPSSLPANAIEEQALVRSGLPSRALGCSRDDRPQEGLQLVKTRRKFAGKEGMSKSHHRDFVFAPGPRRPCNGRGRTGLTFP